ncbi:MAG TPA: hypothetical protein VHL31_19810 [Geminicoccus sp.]|jgi:hypothetical protein|uniref:hypothetical protein n=1 Tax=Geminicoccus sp. TaxID=2024832 RepID=UPI002E30FAA4|nr:hypothetical protein [Geminicoccus sp.]HEX2528529.1 hypothetical protein [Geminicoccus sp.]
MNLKEKGPGRHSPSPYERRMSGSTAVRNSHLLDHLAYLQAINADIRRAFLAWAELGGGRDDGCA